MSNYYGGWGAPPGWGMPPQYGPPSPYPQQSGVIYVPMPNPVKETDDPATAFVKQKEMFERVEKLFKKEDHKHTPKGLGTRDIWWLMAVLTLPVGMAYGGMLYLVIKGLRSL